MAPALLYEASLTVMMRLVFILCAEERGLFLLGDPLLRPEPRHLNTSRTSSPKKLTSMARRSWSEDTTLGHEFCRPRGPSMPESSMKTCGCQPWVDHSSTPTGTRSSKGVPQRARGWIRRRSHSRSTIAQFCSC